MSDSQIRTIERFFEMVSQPAQTAALNAALRLGVIDSLEQGQKKVAELADQCSINERGIEAMLQILSVTGMVEQFDDYYALSQPARLTPKAVWAIMFDQWTGLEEALKEPGDVADPLAHESDRRTRKRMDQFKAIQSQFQWAATGVALKVTEALGIGTERTAMNVLDIGCGSAIYSMAIAHRDPDTNVQLVDDHVGLARASATVAGINAGTRVQMTESSDLVFPGNNNSFDLVIVADQIHVFSEETRTRILATALRTLKPAGEIAVVDVFPGQPRGQLNCNLFELQLLTGTGRNSIQLPDLTRQLETSGFSEIQYTTLPVAPFTHGLALAAKTSHNGDV